MEQAVASVPFWDRLWCSVDEYCQVVNEGRTKAFERIGSGEILSKKEGSRRLISVPFLLQRYRQETGDLPLMQNSNSEAQPKIEAGIETNNLATHCSEPKNRGRPSREGQTP